MDIIKTKRLELRPLETRYASLLLAIWSDEEVVKTTYIHSIHTEHDCKKRIERICANGLQRNDIGPYAIFKETSLIGVIGAARDSTFEYGLGYQIGRDYWGCGYATEVVKAIIGAAFQIPEIVRVSGDVLTTNKASARVLEKANMKFEGCLRMKFYRNGVFGDFNVYSILRNEYDSL